MDPTLTAVTRTTTQSTMNCGAVVSTREWQLKTMCASNVAIMVGTVTATMDGMLQDSADLVETMIAETAITCPTKLGAAPQAMMLLWEFVARKSFASQDTIATRRTAQPAQKEPTAAKTKAALLAQSDGTLVGRQTQNARNAP